MQGKLLLADRGHLAALKILEHEGIVKMHDLPANPENRVTALVRDVEILTYRGKACRIVYRATCTHCTNSPPSPKRGRRTTAVPPGCRSPNIRSTKLAVPRGQEVESLTSFVILFCGLH